MKLNRTYLIFFSECLGRSAGMLFEKSDKIGNIFITQVTGYLADLTRCGKQLSFSFQDNVFVNVSI